MGEITKGVVLKFQNKLKPIVRKSDSIKLSSSSADYLSKIAPKPVISKKKAIVIPKKKLKNIPQYKDKELKKVPKSLKIELPEPKPIIPRSYLKTVEVPKVEFHEIDPWTKIVELIDKCNQAVLKKKLDFAEIYYGQMQPFYLKLSDEDKRFVIDKIQELQQNIIELRMNKVRKIILTS